MKVIEENPSRLYLREVPWFLFGIFSFFLCIMIYAAVAAHEEFGQWAIAVMLLIAAGLLAGLHYVVHWVDVRFSRPSGRIEIERRGLLFHKKTTYPLGAFQKARQDMSSGSDGSTYRVVLVFDDGIFERMPPGEKERREKARKSGRRQIAPNEEPLTYYFSGLGNTEKLINTINTWAQVR